MEKNIKEWKIIGIVALIIVLTYTILMSFQVTYWKHQNIAYEQYKKEDLRQARIYNSTFANSQNEFIMKIESFPEQDKNIAEALYNIKPEVNKIKQELKDGQTRTDELNKELATRPHNVFNDTRTNLSENYKIYNIDDYMRTFQLKDITPDEILYLENIFNIDSSKISEVIYKYNIQIISKRTDYDAMEQEINQIENEANQKKIRINEMKTSINKVIEENSPILEYQETITTNVMKTAGDYFFTI